MKTTKLFVLALSISSLAALPSMAEIGISINVPAPVVTVPAPVVTVGVPDSYAWDGSEYVGMVGSQYYYLGPNNAWLTLDGPRIGRFHDWEHAHADWQTHAIRNDRYRNDAHGHAAPMHDSHAAPDARDNHDTHAADHSDSHAADHGDSHAADHGDSHAADHSHNNDHH